MPIATGEEPEKFLSEDCSLDIHKISSITSPMIFYPLLSLSKTSTNMSEFQEHLKMSENPEGKIFMD